MSFKTIALIVIAVFGVGTSVLVFTGVIGKPAVTAPGVNDAANKELTRIRELAEKADKRIETQAERDRRFDEDAIKAAKQPLQTFGR